MEEAVMRLFKDRWCVYAHVFEGEVFYIGSGNSGRPGMSQRQKTRNVGGGMVRNPAWHSYTERAGYWDVEIWSWHGSLADAHAHEKDMIAIFDPVANRRPLRLQSKYKGLDVSLGGESGH